MLSISKPKQLATTGNNSAMLVPPRSNIMDSSVILIGRRTEGHGYIDLQF